MMENKVHLYKAGAVACDKSKIQETSYTISVKLVTCEKCKKTNYYKELKDEIECNRPIEKEEFKEPKKQHEYTVGDKIIVVNKGRQHDTFTEMAKKMELENFITGKSCKNGDIGIIKSIMFSNLFNNKDNIGFGISLDNGDDIVISRDGVKLHKEPKKPLKLNLDLVMQENTVVHITTQEECDIISKLADDEGLRSDSGESYSDDNIFGDYLESTCICFYRKSFGSIDFWKRIDYKVLSFAEATTPAKKRDLHNENLMSEPLKESEVPFILEPQYNPDEVAFKTYLDLTVGIEPKKYDMKFEKKVVIDGKKTIIKMYVDVYDFLKAFKVVNPALQHGIKKVLMPGKRGFKSFGKDIDEAISSFKRAKELE